MAVSRGMRLYIITRDKNFDELDDDETVANCQIKDGDKLYLLTYRWTDNKPDVILTKTKSKLQGVEPDDTCLGIKLRAQDQLGIPVHDLKVFSVLSSRKEIKDDDIKPLIKKGVNLGVVTEEDLQADSSQIKEEGNTQQVEKNAKL